MPVEPTLRSKDPLGKPLQVSGSEGKASLPNARWRSGFWRSRNNRNAFKHGHFTREAIEKRRRMRDLLLREATGLLRTMNGLAVTNRP